ncbi:putative glucosyltransferase Lgt1 [Legionella nautarum]|uniref:Putative glucosyltransferase Lgt1 n=1 Tax=Legionella nautarum TaxID=45070 RepID=A0A0W0X1V1_9GAMM|nr:glycosyltransferase family 88 protein [Legionella nautarum]KTD38521.1 putative glucosyltransferase Lgt1 [Legionella nautarum]
MFYPFNPHRHVKIWLSNDPNSFLNVENQLRLIRMRATNPEDEINLVFDSKLLSSRAVDDLHSFCETYNIVAKDIRTDVLPEYNTPEEEDLTNLYEEEIANLNAGGNLGVASDILRWLHPVYELGTYTDFDVPVDTRNLPPTMMVERPFLFNLGSIIVNNDIESPVPNNDTIAVVDSEAAFEDIQKIQRCIYTSCVASPGTSIFETHLTRQQEDLAQLIPAFLVPHLLSVDPNYQLLEQLSSMSKGKSARQVRHEIIQLTKDNNSFSEFALTSDLYSPFLPRQEKIKRAAAMLRNSVQSKLGWLNWLILPSAQYHQIKALASIADDNEFLSKMRRQIRMSLLRTSVVYTSGPSALLLGWLGHLFLTRETIDTNISLFSFAHYGLDKAFVSENSLPLHAKTKAMQAKLAETEIGKVNDLSWLEEGQNATAAREQNIENATRTIQRFFRGNKIRAHAHLPQTFVEMREKIQTHIKKIEADLQGCFGFYRKSQRHDKIKALRGILGHFSDEYFNVGEFQEALDSYRSEDIFASLGKSETKALIDELTLFSKQAKIYGLTNSQGQVSLAISSPTLG